MTQGKHTETPGPFVSRGLNILATVEGSEQFIATVHLVRREGNSQFKDTTEEAEATAALLARAASRDHLFDDLVKALRVARGSIECREPFSPTLSLIDAVLTKATTGGQSPVIGATGAEEIVP